jgi:hypothetical protein
MARICSRRNCSELGTHLVIRAALRSGPKRRQFNSQLLADLTLSERITRSSRHSALSHWRQLTGVRRLATVDHLPGLIEPSMLGLSQQNRLNY